MSMAYIRKTYGVPAKRGRVVEVWEWRRWGSNNCEGQQQKQCPTCGLWAVWMTADGRRANGSGP